MSVQRTRYSVLTTTGAQGDKWLLKTSVDVVNFPYVSGTVTEDTMTLAGVRIEVDDLDKEFAKNNVPSEVTLANRTFTVYDTADRIFWNTCCAPGMASNKRLQLVTWKWDSVNSIYVRDFMGVIDKSSLRVKVKTITRSGVTYESTVKGASADLTKMALQELFLDPTVAGYTTISPAYRSIATFYLPYFWWLNRRTGGSPPSTFNAFGWGTEQWARMYDLLQAFADLILPATDFASAFQTTGNMDHIGVTVRTPGTYPSPTTVRWGAGATAPNDSLMMAVMAFNRHTFIDNSGGVNSNREYNFTKQKTVYDALKLFAESCNCAFGTYYDEVNSKIVLYFQAPASPTITPLLSGNPEIIPDADSLEISPFLFAIPSASCAVMRPDAYNTQGQDDTGSDTFNPSFVSPNARNGGGVNGRTFVLTNFIDNHGVTGYNIPFAENLLTIFGGPNPVTAPTTVTPADYSMFDVNPVGSSPDFWPYPDPFTATQGWGGGMLNGGGSGVYGGSPKLTTAPHYQTALAKQLFSLFCGLDDKGVEGIEFDCELTEEMATALQSRTVFQYFKVRTDALYNFLILGAKYNTHTGDSRRKVHFVAIRNKFDT